MLSLVASPFAVTTFVSLERVNGVSTPPLLMVRTLVFLSYLTNLPFFSPAPAAPTSKARQARTAINPRDIIAPYLGRRSFHSHIITSNAGSLAHFTGERWRSDALMRYNRAVPRQV